MADRPPPEFYRALVIWVPVGLLLWALILGSLWLLFRE